MINLETKKTKPKHRFFIYRHLRNDTGKPFYIGRGAHQLEGASNEVFYNRAYSFHGRTKRWHRVVKKHGYTVEILRDNLTLQEANQAEIEFIKLYGKVKEGGLLVNFKKGGNDGATDHRHTQETIEKLRKANSKSIQDNIDEYVAFEPNTGCWIWMGQFSDGHPKINCNSRTLNASRTIYQHFKGVRLLPKKEGLHDTCGNEFCVNPGHFIVDRPCTIEQQHRTLNEEQVKAIKLSGSTGNFTCGQIGDMYGITSKAVNAILVGRSWKWLKVEGVPDAQKSDYHKKRCKKILCVETGKIFTSAREAGTEMFNAPSSNKNIKRACTKRGRCKAYKGYHFEYV